MDGRADPESAVSGPYQRLAITRSCQETVMPGYAPMRHENGSWHEGILKDINRIQ